VEEIHSQRFAQAAGQHCGANRRNGEDLAENPFLHGVEKLSGSEHAHKESGFGMEAGRQELSAYCRLD